MNQVAETKAKTRACLCALLAVCVGLVCGSALGAPANHGMDGVETTTDAATLRQIAVSYEFGEGVSKNSCGAIWLYCRAARFGDVEAQYRLGLVYAHGRGVSRNDGLAAAWFKLAAGNGDLYASRMLGLLGDESKADRPRCVGPYTTVIRRGESFERWSARCGVVESVYDQARHYFLDPALVLALIEVESGFNSEARSVKGAQGLMQLMPGTAARYGVADSLDPQQNLDGGMAHFAMLMERYRDDVQLALAAYNAGEEAVDRYGGIPPFQETQRFVAKVLQVVNRYRDEGGY